VRGGEPAPSTIDQVRRLLVGLKMPAPRRHVFFGFATRLNCRNTPMAPNAGINRTSAAAFLPLLTRPSRRVTLDRALGAQSLRG
jgi:hypothetical protein